MAENVRSQQFPEQPPSPATLATLGAKPNLTPTEAVALGYFESEQAAANRRWLGHPPRYCKLGRKVLYRKADLDAWLEAAAVRIGEDCTNQRAA